ncbi:MAG TPA: hypothetical protein VGC42_03250, partial [Kofleriaceae bacterium]
NGDVSMKLGGKAPGSGDCNTSISGIEDSSDYKAFRSACDAVKYQKVGWVVTGVMSVAVVGSFVMAFIRDRSSSSEYQASGVHKKRREFAVTPIVSPDGGGATLQIDW